MYSITRLYDTYYYTPYGLIYPGEFLCQYMRDDVKDIFIIAVHRILKATFVEYYINRLYGTAGTERVYHYEF